MFNHQTFVKIANDNNETISSHSSPSAYSRKTAVSSSQKYGQTQQNKPSQEKNK